MLNSSSLVYLIIRKKNKQYEIGHTNKNKKGTTESRQPSVAPAGSKNQKKIGIKNYALLGIIVDIE